MIDLSIQKLNINLLNDLQKEHQEKLQIQQKIEKNRRNLLNLQHSARMTLEVNKIKTLQKMESSYFTDESEPNVSTTELKLDQSNIDTNTGLFLPRI